MKKAESKKTASEQEREKELKALQKKIAEEKKTRDKEIQNLIFANTESLTKKDVEKRENKLKVIIGGRETTVGEIKDSLRLLRDNAKAYKVTFVDPYYDGLRKVTGFKKREDNPHYKPGIFAVYTIRFIYSRFLYKDFIEQLRQRNPFLAGLNLRNFKHFQFLNEDAQKMLEGYIQDMIAVLDECNTFQEFEEKYCRKYKLIWEPRLF
jgi:hypothetical protein